jgi:polyisoprenoid-binding protein YceI
MEYLMKLFLLPLLMLFGLPALCAESLWIDPNHSAVVFHWNHRGISNPFARFEKIEGKLVLDDADLSKSSVTVKLAVDGLRTGVAKLDQRLMSAEFLDAATYPEITFTSIAIEKGPGDSFKVTGKLVLHGVSKTVVLDGKINQVSPNKAAKATAAGFDATVVLRRDDFGVSKYLPAVAEELFVRITVAAHSEE